jgi:hypothetical protein
MRIFIDNHHEELTESLRILFQDRLGWEVYRPIGVEWWKEGYWHIYDHPGTAEQYLGYCVGDDFRAMQERQPKAGHTFRNINIKVVENSEGMYSVGSAVYPEVTYLGITLDRFKVIPFDIVLSSIPSHIDPFNKLVSLYHPQAKHIFQIGNNWPVDYPVKNILCSSKWSYGQIAKEKNSVLYHQEFSSKLFSFDSVDDPKAVYNMMHYIQNMDEFEKVEQLLPTWTFKCFGAENRDLPKGPNIYDIVNCFKEMGFLWHVKREGDGYGYNLAHAAACGKPIITKCSNYRGMSAEPLLIHGKTCIDLDRVSLSEAAKMLQNMADNYSYYSNEMYNTFKQTVDFDKEEKDIRLFIDRLL